MHADGKASHELVWDADVAHFMDRMEQALYDVLLNKKHWHDPSQDRRDLWHPLAGTSDNKGGIFVTEKAGGIRLAFQLFDGFRSYPHDMSADINKPPEEWWCKFPQDISGRCDGDANPDVTSPSPAVETNTVSAPPGEDPRR